MSEYAILHYRDGRWRVALVNEKGEGRGGLEIDDDRALDPNLAKDELLNIAGEKLRGVRTVGVKLTAGSIYPFQKNQHDAWELGSLSDLKLLGVFSKADEALRKPN